MNNTHFRGHLFLSMMARKLISRLLAIPRPDPIIRHGRSDAFAYLQNPLDRRTKRCIQAENANFQKWEGHLRKLQSELHNEMMSTPKPREKLNPERFGPYEYFKDYIGEHRCDCRRPVGSEGPVQVLLDVNQLLKRFDYVNVRMMTLSPDQSRLAVAIDTTSTEQYVLHVIDIAKGISIEENLVGPIVSVEWGQTNEELFYTTMSDQLRPYKVMYRKLGTPNASDQVLHFEPDERCFVDISKTLNSKYIVINSNSKTSSEIHLIQLADKRTWDRPFCLVPRMNGRQAFVNAVRDTFFFVTNQPFPSVSPDSYVVATTLDDLAITADEPAETRIKRWQCLAQPESDARKLEDIHLFYNHLVIIERYHGLPSLRVVDFPPGDAPIQTTSLETHQISLPDPICEVTVGGNPDPQSETFRFSCSSPLQRESVFDYNMRDRKLLLLSKAENNYDQYRVVRVHTPTSGVPVTVIASSERVQQLEANGPSSNSKSYGPMLVHAYGSYGVSQTLEYREEWMPLLARGWSIVLAHVRGGGELGREWHAAGRQLNKPRSFEDLEEVCNWLTQTGFVQQGQIAGIGASAGGLLFGAVANRRPDLFRTIALEAPFLDNLTACLDPTLPLTIHEYDEWGNPEDKDVLECIRSYAPYDNLSPQSNYPALMLVSSLNDARVQYWHALKFVTKLRWLSRSLACRPILLRVEDSGGHFGDNTYSVRLSRRALQYAFMINQFESTANK